MQQPPRKTTSISLETEVKSTSITAAKPKKKEDPAVTFTEAELDRLLSNEVVDQELKKMFAKDLLPSQKMQKVTADITEAFRWQENKEAELHKMKVSDTANSKTWVNDLAEDFITYGVSPAHTPEEAKVILESLDKELQVQAEAGFGPDARNYIVTLRKELELLIEKL